jgi:3'-phosphoadenosine 5'-phosphosulfate (PAPS) 3'-phosphatase
MPYLEQLNSRYGPNEISLEPFRSFDTKDAVVWIDPLDGTKEFVRGNLTSVTVLIGLSLNGYSRFGIVHQPYSHANSNHGVTYFGSGEHGTFQMDYDFF